MVAALVVLPAVLGVLGTERRVQTQERPPAKLLHRAA
jgi:hypothetical protein